MGPRSLSTVERAFRISPQERDIVKLFFDVSDAPYFSEVTADPPLFVEVLYTPIGAGELGTMDTSKLLRLIRGNGLQRIADILQRPQPQLLQRPRTRRQRTHIISYHFR